MNTREFITQVSATPEERDILEIISSSSPVKKLEGLYSAPLDVLRSSYFENPYIWNALLQDFSGDRYSFRPYVKALKGLHPKDPKGLSILTFMMALSIEVDEPLVQPNSLYIFRKEFSENTEESFGLYCYLLYFSLPFEDFPGLKKYGIYTKRIREASPLEHFPEQFSLLQFLFQGNPLEIGKGDSGGLSTFLLQLGKALTRSMEISQVFTLSLRDISADYSKGHSKNQQPYQLIQKIDPDHFSISVPFHVGEDQGFIKSHVFLKAMVSVVLKKLKLNPNIYHVRYLNDASLAMTMLGRERKGSVVLTLAPDPHRSMVHEESQKVIGYGYKEGIEKIHKIEVGKKLVQATHGIIGIGGEHAKQRLLQYFPELSLMPRNKPFQMISEGIDIHLPTNQRIDLEKVLTSPDHEYAIDFKNLSKPCIFNVGRLNPMKGQQRLLEAFNRSGVYKKYNLVLIGGNVENPNEAEAEFFSFEKAFLKEHPELRGSFLHIPGIPNTTVRLIERKVNEGKKDVGKTDAGKINVRKTKDGSSAQLPNIYFCSSRKEEFGIAILEAMVEGFIAFGPKAGGVSTYIQHGVNGFIGETGTVRDLEMNLKEIIDYFEKNPEKAVEIRENSRKTIEEKYSMEGISLNFAEFYREVLSYEAL